MLRMTNCRSGQRSFPPVRSTRKTIQPLASILVRLAATHHSRRFTSRRARRVRAVSTGLRYTIEEINDPSFQRILGTDDEQSLILDDALEDL
jgi:hypothetical protein